MGESLAGQQGVAESGKSAVNHVIGAGSATRVLIIQPYVPTYRAPFFAALRTRMEDRGFSLELAAGVPNSESQSRRDDVSREVADVMLPDRRLSIFGKEVGIRSIGTVLERQQPDLVVVEQAVKNLEIYPLLLRSHLLRGPDVAMWGQGRTFSTRQTRLVARAKAQLTKAAAWNFVYTEAGRDYLAGKGIDPRRVTVVNNSIDTMSLRGELESVSASDVAEFRLQYELGNGPVGLFLGGVDRHKGIDFLLESVRLVRSQRPDFTLLVGGGGAGVDQVKDFARAFGGVRYLGRVDGKDKALALRTASLMMIPQWVGLVAVDSLTAGCPIVTTRHASHSPEFAYLDDGRNARVVAHDTSAYATTIGELLRDVGRLDQLRAQAQRDSLAYSVESMADRFIVGFEQWRAQSR